MKISYERHIVTFVTTYDFMSENEEEETPLRRKTNVMIMPGSEIGTCSKLNLSRSAH